MLNALVLISSIYCVGFLNNFLQSFAVLYIAVRIPCEGPKIRCKGTFVNETTYTKQKSLMVNRMKGKVFLKEFYFAGDYLSTIFV